jgi:hypothetical protein
VNKLVSQRTEHRQCRADAHLRERLRELAAMRRRFGCRLQHVLLMREGMMMNTTAASITRSGCRPAGGRKRHASADRHAAAPQSALEHPRPNLNPMIRIRTPAPSTHLRLRRQMTSPIQVCQGCLPIFARCCTPIPKRFLRMLATAMSKTSNVSLAVVLMAKSLPDALTTARSMRQVRDAGLKDRARRPW